VILLANTEHGVGLTAHFGPPEFQVAREGACADLAEAVGFGEMFNADYS